jgi:hypothetical protein
MYIPNETSGYARLAWDSSAGYPAGLTLGNLGGVAANVQFTGSDEPFYMLAFTDLTKGLGQNNANDQILMIEFQPSALVGNTLGLNPTTTLFNLFDNVTGTYLGTGQSDVNTLAGWGIVHPFLEGESLQQVRIGIGMAGGGSDSVTLTVNSVDLTAPSAVPEPTSLLLLLTVVGATGWGIRRRQPRNRRS